jgi:hypothetical protein
MTVLSFTPSTEDWNRSDFRIIVFFYRLQNTGRRTKFEKPSNPDHKTWQFDKASINKLRVNNCGANIKWTHTAHVRLVASDMECYLLRMQTARFCTSVLIYLIGKKRWSLLSNKMQNQWLGEEGREKLRYFVCSIHTLFLATVMAVTTHLSCTYPHAYTPIL